MTLVARPMQLLQLNARPWPGIQPCTLDRISIPA
jgi:hypothetical protein